MVDMKRLYKILVFLFMVAMAMQVSATVVKSLYEVDYPVADRTTKARDQAVTAAFRQVLVKVTGNTGIAALGRIQEAITHANGYVQSYNYVQTGDDNSSSEGLHVAFDPSEVNMLLHKTGQPIWGKDRPSTLIWLAVQKGKQHDLVGSNDGPVADLLQNTAEWYGLPIILPLNDLEDLANVSTNDVWHLNPAIVDLSIKRYGMQSVLLGHAEQTDDDSWQAEWLFSLNGESIHWHTQGKTLDENVNAIMSDLINAMATRFAVLSDNTIKQSVMLDVNNISGLDDYADVMKYLRSLEPVTHVEVTDIDPNYVEFTVTTIGGEQALVNAISSDHKLIFAQSPRNTLNYRWVP